MLHAPYSVLDHFLSFVTDSNAPRTIGSPLHHTETKQSLWALGSVDFDHWSHIGREVLARAMQPLRHSERDILLSTMIPKGI